MTKIKVSVKKPFPFTDGLREKIKSLISEHFPKVIIVYGRCSGTPDGEQRGWKSITCDVGDDKSEATKIVDFLNSIEDIEKASIVV